MHCPLEGLSSFQLKIHDLGRAAPGRLVPHIDKRSLTPLDAADSAQVME
jgi:hypothetical protein